MSTRQRKSYMNAQEFRALRAATGLPIGTWAVLLDCGTQSVRNMENGSASIGRQMAMLAILMAHPTVRTILPEIFRYKDDILRKEQNTP